MWEYVTVNEEYNDDGHVPVRVGGREFPVAEPSQ